MNKANIYTHKSKHKLSSPDFPTPFCPRIATLNGFGRLIDIFLSNLGDDIL